MDPNRIKCMCGETFNVGDFQNHFGKCQQFKAEFKDFDSKFGELLKAYSEPKEKLLIVRFLLKLYIAVIEKKLKKYYDNVNKSQSQGNPPFGMNPPAPAPAPGPMSNPPPIQNISNFQHQQNISNNNMPGIGNDNYNPNQFNPNSKSNAYPDLNMQQQKNVNPPGIIENPWAKKNSENNNNNNNINNMFNKDNLNKNNNSQNYDEDFEPQPEQKEEENSNICHMCKTNPNILYLECVHPICYNCFEKEAKSHLFEMKCKICNKEISEQLKKEVLQDKFTSIEKIALMKIIGAEGAEIIKCPYPECASENVFESGQVDYNIKDDNGKLLSRQAAEDYAKNRCRCGFCKKDFCKTCIVMPYHLGMTCDEKKRHQIAKKCRFCDTEIKGFNMGPDDDVCNGAECRQRYMISCKKRIPC